MLLALAMFLLSNRGAVTLNFWPFGLLGRIALGAVILVALAAGVFAGLMLHWPHRIRAQRRTRLAERRAAALQAQLDAHQPVAQTPVVQAPVVQAGTAVILPPERIP